MKRKIVLGVSLFIILSGVIFLWALEKNKTDFIVKLEVNQKTLPKARATIIYKGSQKEVKVSHGMSIFGWSIRGLDVDYNPGYDMPLPSRYTILKKNVPYTEEYEIMDYQRLQNGKYEVKVWAGFESDGKSYSIPAKAVITVNRPNGNYKMVINNVPFFYDKNVMDAVDQSKRIDKKNPPTVKAIRPTRKPQYTIEVKNKEKTTETYKLWDDGDDYLVDIEKGTEDFWLVIEKTDYKKAKERLAKFNRLEVPYPITIYNVDRPLSIKYNNCSASPIEGLFALNLPISDFQQEQDCYLEKTECINFYQGNMESDAALIKQKLEGILSTANFNVAPKIYSVRNIVMLYIPHNKNYSLEKDIVESIKLVK